MPKFYNKIFVGVIFGFQVFRKDTFRATFSPKRSSKTMTCSYWTAPCRDPVFQETIVITVPLRPTGFQKVVFSGERLAHSVFSDLFRVMFYITFLSLFHKTYVNAKPLNPPCF